MLASLTFEWEQYEVDGDDYIPIDRWGQDHWSTLAYLETRAVDGKGKVDNGRMRCNLRLHREFAYSHYTGLVDGSKYPTRLRDGVTQDRHDDWSCLEDMCAAGVLRAWYRQIKFGEPFGNSEARIELTDKGIALCAELRAHKARGGSWASFVPADA